MFCLLSVSCLSFLVNCFVPIHTTIMLTVCYINRQPGRGYHYSETNACGESAASKKNKTKNKRSGCFLAIGPGPSLTKKILDPRMNVNANN